MTFERIKNRYADELWNRDMVKIAYKKGAITKKQCREILAIDPTKDHRGRPKKRRRRV